MFCPRLFWSGPWALARPEAVQDCKIVVRTQSTGCNFSQDCPWALKIASEVAARDEQAGFCISGGLLSQFANHCDSKDSQSTSPLVVPIEHKDHDLWTNNDPTQCGCWSSHSTSFKLQHLLPSWASAHSKWKRSSSSYNHPRRSRSHRVQTQEQTQKSPQEDSR